MQPKKSRKQSRRRTRAFSSGDRWTVVARNAGRSSLLKRPMMLCEANGTSRERCSDAVGEDYGSDCRPQYSI